MKNQVLDNYFRENYKRLIQIARRRVGNYSLHSAEDAVQEAFTRACKYYRTYNSGENFDGWFRGILNNCINQIKKDERSQGVVTTDDVEEIGTEVHSVQFTKEVQSILVSLRERDQIICVNYFFHDLRSREIAEIMEISHDVVRDVIRRFRQKLR